MDVGFITMILGVGWLALIAMFACGVDLNEPRKRSNV